MVFHTGFPLCRGKSSSSSSMNINEPVKLFSSLISDIERLKTSLAGDSITLKWCSEAINLLRKMHSHFLLFFEKYHLPVLWYGTDILEEYMKETLDLLDLCNSLKSAISGMQRYRLMIEFAAGKLRNGGNISDATTKITEIERLVSESKKIYGVEKWKDMNLFKTEMPKTKSKDSTICFIYAIKSSMRLVGMLLFSALLYPISITMDKEVYRRVSPQLKSFSVSIGKLVGCFLKVLEGVKDKSMPILVENKVIEKAVLDIKAQVLKGKAVDQEKLINLLKQSSLVLKERMEMFESVVDELFEEVVNGRNKVLAMVDVN
ncbi:protein BPS1, chloroplastic-like [Juglans microcarpa x Juglans regia]|uniref:protein BPS1, chloroplastic-like n=1 Tax=Juglans microcarpa x Juglans regia TaxID=2249226 RepID=UPI001B7F1734|nr:protein BPS1, chloroplastic-like [Juglans microcarpa x Juglans regia]